MTILLLILIPVLIFGLGYPLAKLFWGRIYLKSSFIGFSIGCGLCILVFVNTFLVAMGYGEVGSRSYDRSFLIAFLLLSLILVSKRFAKVKLVWFGELDKPEVYAIGFLYLLICLIALRFGELTLPYRIGIDPVGYASCARFFFKGGTYDSILAKILSNKSGLDLIQSYISNKSELNYNLFVASDFIIGSVRWGLSSLFASLALLLGLDSPIPVVYPILALFMGQIFSQVYRFILEVIRVNRSIAIMGSYAVTLNPNILNLLHEGSWGQLVAISALLFGFRYSAAALAPSAEEVLSKNLERIKIKSYDAVLMTFIMSSLLPVYNEGWIVGGFVLGLGILITSFVYRFSIKVPIKTGMPFVYSLLFMSPFVYKWLKVIGLRFTSLTIGGWPQPVWAMPSEILGLSDIYYKVRDMVGHQRAPLSFIYSIVLSSFLVGVLLWWLKVSKNKLKYLFVGVFIFIFTIYFKTQHLDKIHSYQYMKAYCFFVPILIIILIDSLSKAGEINVVYHKVLKYLLVVPIILGVNSSMGFIGKSLYITTDELNLTKAKVDFSEYALFYADQEGGIRLHTWAGLIDYNYIFRENVVFKTEDFNKKLAVIIDKRYEKRFDLFDKLANSAANKHSTVYYSGTIIIIDTGLKVSDILPFQTEKERYNETRKILDKMLMASSLNE